MIRAAGPGVALTATAIPLAGAAVALGGTRTGAMIVVLAALGVVLTRVEIDQVTATAALALGLLLVPAVLRFGPLGAAGTPASLLAMAAAAAWLWGRVLGRPWLATGRQPLRVGLLLFAATVLASYVAMGFRPHDAIESSAADRGLFTVVGLAGVALFAADGIPSRAGLRTVVRVTVAGGAVMAALGILQFATRIDIARQITLPGFSVVASDYADERSGFTRIVSTTSHPIELSVVLAILLPLALHVAWSCGRHERLRWWTAGALIAVAAPLTVSRTAVLGLVLAMGILFAGWDRGRRRRALVVAPLGVLALGVVVPGLVGTLRSLIFSAGNDPSITSRQQGYDYVATFLAERPLFGRGWQTFLPDRYQYLDNQVLLGLAEIGLVGTAIVIGVHLVGAASALAVRRHGADPGDRDLGLSLLASIAVGLASWLTFDALSFPTSRMLTFLCIGLAAALWRIARHPAGNPVPPAWRWDTSRPAAAP